MDPNLNYNSAAASTSTNDVDDWEISSEEIGKLYTVHSNQMFAADYGEAIVKLSSLDATWIENTEGFVVPSILTGNSDTDAGKNPSVTCSTASSSLTNPEQRRPPINTGLENSTTTTTDAGIGRKQKLKHKLREADKKFAGKTSGRENRIENLREIMGPGTQTNSSDGIMKGLPRDWLDPHCHESEFDRSAS